ncbi:hypothetical protein MD484_g8021, partial [Candolleomyces efflorescens]
MLLTNPPHAALAHAAALSPDPNANPLIFSSRDSHKSLAGVAVVVVDAVVDVDADVEDDTADADAGTAAPNTGLDGTLQLPPLLTFLADTPLFLSLSLPTSSSISTTLTTALPSNTLLTLSSSQFCFDLVGAEDEDDDEEPENASQNACPILLRTV